MKKSILISAVALIVTSTIISCNNERMAVNTVESMKTKEMANFDNAMKSLGKPENRPTDEERRNANSTELSDRRKELLIPASKALILSTGISEVELQRKTNGDKSAIIVWAIQINIEKNAKIRKNLKLEN
jgi:hypothetical protein